ncbi:MAG: chitobiase/beta-hexosaminidase C-terminal domain-containing protein [Lachnospiraceae bacterium]|nr:chitobiase/beta-hexosaminidase C-terminal domain-containing protein [Lachnospiraceae bacterium]
MKKIALVNIYNFIRMSHQEPSQFIQADFDTIARQIRILKQYGLPSTYALKYDALMDPHYQKLLLSSTDENDEIAAWWEISEPLCQRAGVTFRGKTSEVFDERVDSAYSAGYAPDERRRLVDAYMKDFHSVFGYYPKTIGSWILDEVTLSHAHDRYGVIGAAICRDQIGTDGFTLWGGWPNGVYFPSRQNMYLPSQTMSETLGVATFRLLAPDPVYSFEQDVRDGLAGVYTLEPCCPNGRIPERISWYFSTLTDENCAGITYAQVGQENNFLWENIKPGFEPQIRHLKKLCEEGQVRLETMAESADWFSQKYAVTPPLSWQASAPLLPELRTDAAVQDSKDAENEKPLSVTPAADCRLDALWYASRFYRISFLAEKGHLRIRDWFLFDEKYPGRYLKQPMTTKKSTFDALPLLFAQEWGNAQNRPLVRLMENSSQIREVQGDCRFYAPDEFTSCAEIRTDSWLYRFTMGEDRILLERTAVLSAKTDCMEAPNMEGKNMRSPNMQTQNMPAERGCGLPKYNFTEGCFTLHFDCLPVFDCQKENRIILTHEAFSYGFRVETGKIVRAEKSGLEIQSCGNKICLYLTQEALSPAAASFTEKSACGASLTDRETLFTPAYLENPAFLDNWQPNWVKHPTPAGQTPPFEVTFAPSDRVFDLAAGPAKIQLSVPEKDAVLRYADTADVLPTEAALYEEPLTLFKDTRLYAVSFLPDGRTSETAFADYHFGWKDVILKSGTEFDKRPFFDGRGITGLLKENRGTLDWQDGRWVATLENLDFTCILPEERLISTVLVGFLTSHRAGIIYPEALELYLGDDFDHLTLFDTLRLPEGPAEAEIAKQDFGFYPNIRAKCVRFVARRYAFMPQWCCYKGSPGIFTMADNLIIH